jgi:3-hydroxyacyl-CoA dehydrogenase
VDLHEQRTGYGWKQGPFELIDRLGAGWLKARLEARDLAVPPYLALAAERGGFYSVVNGRRSNLLPDGTVEPVARSEGVLLLADLELAGKPVEDWGVARLWDIGDGVACFEIRSKMNTLGAGVLDALEAALARVASGFKALVVGSDGPIYSAGADLRDFLREVESGGPTAFGPYIDRGHRVFKSVKYAPFPVVGAAGGLALGDGCELLLHCRAIQVHAVLNIGLVETRIGVVPGWGGCKEMLLRFAEGHAGPKGPVAPAIAAFNLISAAKGERLRCATPRLSAPHRRHHHEPRPAHRRRQGEGA